MELLGAAASSKVSTSNSQSWFIVKLTWVDPLLRNKFLCEKLFMFSGFEPMVSCSVQREGEGQKVLLLHAPCMEATGPLVGSRGLMPLLFPSLQSSKNDPRGCMSIKVAMQLLHLKPCATRTGLILQVDKNFFIQFSKDHLLLLSAGTKSFDFLTKTYEHVSRCQGHWDEAVCRVAELQVSN